MWLRKAASATALAIAALLGSSPASGGERAIGDALVVASGACFDKDALAARVIAVRSSDRIDDRIAFEVRVDGDVASILMVGPGDDGPAAAVRRIPLAGASCDDQTAAIALAVALAVDAMAITPRKETPRKDAPRIEVKRPPPSPPPAPPDSAPSTAGFAATADFVAMSGPMPEPVLGLAPALEVSFTRGVEARAGLLFTTATDIALLTGHVDASLLAGDVAGCAAFQWGERPGASRLRALRVQACAGVFAGTFRTTVTAGRAATPAPLWVAPYARVALRFGVSERFGVETGLRVVVPVTRPEVDAIDDAGRVEGLHRLGQIAGAIEIGPHFLFL